MSRRFFAIAVAFAAEPGARTDVANQNGWVVSYTSATELVDKVTGREPQR